MKITRLPLVEQWFKGPPPETLEALPLMVLGGMGAFRVYALNHPDVLFHATQTEEELKQSEEALKSLLKINPQSLDEFKEKHPDLYEMVMIKREGWAVRELSRFFDQYPEQKTTVFIYGFRHNICDDIQKTSWHPFITSVWWEFQGALLSLKGNIPQACPKNP